MFSYTVTGETIQNLSKIESLRRELVLLPLSQAAETQLKWEAQAARLYGAFPRYFQTQDKVSILDEIAELSENESGKLLPLKRYKDALDYIYHDWLVTETLVDLSIILKLYGIISGKTSVGLSESASEALQYLLDHLQSRKENPVVLSGIAYIQFLILSPFEDNNSELAMLLSFLFLYRFGYDFRKMLVIKEFWIRNYALYQREAKKSASTSNFTSWLYFYSQTILAQVDRALNRAKELKLQNRLPETFWTLNDRQKKILNYLCKPTSSINNTRVQKMFNISQITASRDLSKLVSLNLIIPVGKGRAISYIKS